jgi:hypothetical protein
MKSDYRQLKKIWKFTVIDFVGKDCDGILKNGFDSCRPHRVLLQMLLVSRKHIKRRFLY